MTGSGQCVQSLTPLVYNSYSVTTWLDITCLYVALVVDTSGFGLERGSSAKGISDRLFNLYSYITGLLSCTYIVSEECDCISLFRD